MTETPPESAAGGTPTGEPTPRKPRKVAKSGAAKKPRGDRRSKNQLLESAERAKYYKAKTQQIEAANRKALGELVHPDVLEFALAQVAQEIAAGLAALPSQIKVDIPHLRAAEVTLISNRVARLRNAFARIEIDYTRTT
jgi:phage terminase Nu1 subunit (DNA packaging protein)